MNTMEIKSLNHSEMQGKKVKRIYYGRDGECLQEAKKSDNYRKEIILNNNFHGEYDLVWVVVVVNGIETLRINAKFIETIEWEPV